MPKNVIQHFEWTTRDADRLKAFFGEIFDWKFSQPMPDYTLIEGVGGKAYKTYRIYEKALA